MTNEISDARMREITSCLQRRVTFEEACTRLTDDAQNVVHPTVVQLILEWVLLIGTEIAFVCLIRRIENGPTKPSAESLRSWLSASEQISDELWEYDTKGNSWENLHGECGYALVRGGRVIQFWMYQMN